MEKQKKVKANEDPVIETTEMKARAKVLEQHLQKLVKRKVPKPKKTSTSTTATATATTSAESAEATGESNGPDADKDEQSIPQQDAPQDQIPIQPTEGEGRPHDEL